ncbi:MAG: CDP-glycerol glycerophosphotransferase family protein [bacterium]|nr:CDP-glycerol glycerophosphotransferase family protein [bacterium]
MRRLKKAITRMADHCKLLRKLMVIGVLQKRKISFFMRSRKVKCLDEKLVIFEAFGGRSYGCNPKALYLAMINKKEEYGGYALVWCFRKPEDYLFLQKNDNTRLVKYRSKEYYDCYARAKYFITNYRLPQEIKKRKEQIYVQCWHGVPLKRLGYDIAEYQDRTVSTRALRRQYTKAAKDYTYLLSPSKYYTEKLTSAFHLKELHKEDIFIEKGYPRNDALYGDTDKEQEKIRRALGISEEKRVILYCPTYRENEYTVGVGNTIELGIDFHHLSEALSKDYVLLFRAHYLIKSKFQFEEFQDFIIDVSNYQEINDLYIASDLLVTDYSSVMFDYAILEKPIVLYMYDLEEYKTKLRDFYLEFEELPTAPVTKEEDLIRAIEETKEFQMDDRYQRFNETHNQRNGPNTSEVILKEIFHH